MKKKKLIRIGSLLGMLMLIINACEYNQAIPLEESVGDVGEMSFSSDIIPIFNSSCNMSGCHNQGGQKPDLSPNNAHTSLTNGGYTNTAVPENSPLYQWMKGDKAQPMPLSGPNAIYNAKIKAWIKQGALNN